MTLDEALDLIDEQFICHEWVDPGADRDLAPTGERYLTVCSGGVKPEGKLPAAFFTSEAAAVTAWVIAVQELGRDDENGPLHYGLYWRTKPQVEFVDYVPKDKPSSAPPLRLYNVFARLAIQGLT